MQTYQRAKNTGQTGKIQETRHLNMGINMGNQRQNVQNCRVILDKSFQRIIE